METLRTYAFLETAILYLNNVKLYYGSHLNEPKLNWQRPNSNTCTPLNYIETVDANINFILITLTKSCPNP